MIQASVLPHFIPAAAILSCLHLRLFKACYKTKQPFSMSFVCCCRVDADRVVTNRPLAGTRRRGVTAAADLALEQELLADEKECAEHVMLVDLGRNDVGKVGWLCLESPGFWGFRGSAGGL